MMIQKHSEFWKVRLVFCERYLQPQSHPIFLFQKDPNPGTGRKYSMSDFIFIFADRSVSRMENRKNNQRNLHYKNKI